MNDEDKRKAPRIVTHNLIYYVCLDENDEPVGQGMGRTLDISEGGILLETHAIIDPKHTLSFTISLEDEMMDIKGKVAYYRKGRDNTFEYGIQFIEVDESKTMVLKQFAVMFKD